MNTQRVYLLTNKQYARRFTFISLVAFSGFAGVQIMKGYVADREQRFLKEYAQLKSDPNFYHTLHEQVALGFDAKVHEGKERQSGIDSIRKSLVSKADGIVLETAIGHNLNIGFYDFARIKKLFGCDWVESSLNEAGKRAPSQDVTLFNCDMHKTPFADASFDTVVDTFGLECAYDIERAFAELKRLTKPGGKILLLERGKGYWLFDNFKLMLKCSVNMSARA